MNAQGDSIFVAAATRRLAVRLRPDLEIVRERSDGHTWWMVKDPVAARYFRFREEEAAVMELLDGQTSLADIRARFEERFTPRTISETQIHSFVGALHQSGLVLTDRSGQGQQLLERHQAQRRRQRLAALTNVLAIRFRGFDPDGLLNWMYPCIRWMFTRWFAALAVALVVAALLLVAINFDRFWARLPALDEFFQARSLLWMAAALGFSKVLHELGHALTCKHFGGECHELGLMLLVFTPCLYCNTSDAWMLPSKWRRATIASAGMAVELVLAAAATIIWWLTPPGALNSLCLSTMLTCSVNTLLLNGNPLLRFDGYFILSHLLEVPNLAHKAKAVLVDELSARCLGLPRRSQSLLPERRRGWFALYAVASTVYRWTVTLGILWFLKRLFVPYNLEIIGQALLIFVLGGMIGSTVWSLYKFFRVPGRMQQVKRRRLAATCLVLAAVALAVWYVPLPSRAYATLVIEPRDAQRLYVTAPGVLEEVRVRPGERVETGDVVAVLSDRKIEWEVAQLQGQVEQQRLKLQSLERRRVADPTAGPQIPAVEQSLADLEDRLKRRLTERDRLTLKAARAGVVLPPAATSPPPALPGRLASWSGLPLDRNNLGCYLENETLFCLIGEPTRLQATLVIDQADVELVSIGQEVEIQLDALPGQTLPGRIEEVAENDLLLAPRQLSTRRGGELETQSDASGQERPTSTSYQARVSLDDAQGQILLGYRGRAKIHLAPQTLGQRLSRYLSQTFNFRS